MNSFMRGNSKKLLIDALYINESGGLRLLEYLITTLEKRQIDYFLLADARCSGRFDYCKSVHYMIASLYERRRFYKANARSFSSVLCFGNIPSPIKLNVPVYTYFHNINLLTLAEASSLAVKVKSWLKREVFRFYKRNTDFWLVQTSNTKNELINHLGENAERVKLMPFYDLPDELSMLNGEKHGEDYVYISTYVPGKGHETLLAAWRILHKKGINRTLHLTVPFDSHPFVDEVEKAKRLGVDIINHGIIPFDQVIELYHQSKAIVYPSHNESLGLGIVEALTAGCDVIGADLPYLHSICQPSNMFNPYSSYSLADAIIEYEKGMCTKSKLYISNQINNLIELISQN